MLVQTKIDEPVFNKEMARSAEAPHFAVKYFIKCIKSAYHFDSRELITYGTEIQTFPHPSIHIIQSQFFGDSIYGTPASLPPLPLKEIEGVPLLFGQPQIERRGQTLVVHADIIASAYFLLTRYEEYIRRDIRDKHMRFPGIESLPQRAGFLHRPVVDEYAALLRKWLRELGVDVPEPPQKINKIYLTHDVDHPFAWVRLMDLFKASVKRALLSPLHLLDPMLSYSGFMHGRDPYDCFDWILDQDVKLQEILGKHCVEPVFFFLAGDGHPYDGRLHIQERRTRRLIDRIRNRGGKIGLHSSYAAGIDPCRIHEEKALLEKVVGEAIVYNRNHFLNNREPEHMTIMAQTGITDDFSMGYADIAGFRVGTCRPYKWFDPVDKKSTNLTVHPLTIMECTLDRREYMYLDYETALDTCFALVGQTARHNGEAVLLWHNTEFTAHKQVTGSYQQKLYVDLLHLLRNGESA